MTDPANLSFPEEYAKQDDMVTSPDGAIKARIVGGQVTKLEFKPNAYKNYSEIELAHQIVQLARLGNAARTRGYRRTLDKVLGHGEAIARRGPGSPPRKPICASCRICCRKPSPSGSASSTPFG